MLEVNVLKKLLGIEIEPGQDSKDFVLQFILEDVEQIILSYCNITKLPAGLNHTAYRMAVDLYRNESIGQEALEGNVTNIKEGDVTVSMSNSYDTAFRDSLLKNYEKQLQQYRKLRW